tara:strand:- start:289 stop:531 length:243 start_codon:yes stop_codon:yes gene_type:complete
MKHIEYKVKVYTNGDKFWFLHGKHHREDGPAIEWSDGTKEWYLNGKHLTEKQFNKKMKKPCENKIVEIDGIKYKLTVMED